MAPNRAAQTASAKPPSDWSLVGRQEELALCESCLAGERWRGVVVAGAPGVGKTRLMLEALVAAAGFGRVTARVTATESGRAVPLGALAHLLPVELTRAPTTFDLLRRAEVAFMERSQREPLVLCVDDAHLLDPASAMLVHQLVADGSAIGLLTVRSGEPAPDAVTALWKDHGCAFLELQPLSREETSSLLESELGGPLEGRTEHALWQASRGVPLVLGELVLEGLDRGVLVEELGLWRWHGELAIGRRLRELVAARIGDLDDLAREALELVALGEPLSSSWLSDPETVDSLVRRGVLEAERNGRRLELRFAHPLQGEVVRSEMPATRASRLQRRLADALDATGARRSGDVLRLATWRLEGGGEVSSKLLVLAARRAQLSFAPELGERLARAAVELGGGLEASYVLACARAGQGDFLEAESMLGTLEGQAGSDAERAMIAETRARWLAGPLGRGADAATEIARARAAVDDRSSQAKLALAEGWIRFRLGGPSQALAAVAPTVEDAAVETSVRASAAAFCVLMLAQTGRPLEALALANRSLPGSELTNGNPSTRAETGFARGVALMLAGQMELAEGTALTLYETAVESDDDELLGRAAWLYGVTSLNSGRVDGSLRLLRESVTVLRELDPRGMLPWALAMVAQAAAQAGNADEASSAVKAAQAVAPSGSWIYTASIEMSRAWASAAEGALSQAQRSALLAGEICLERGQLAAAFIDFHDLCRLGGSELAAPRLAKLAREVEGDWVHACADHAAALVAQDAASLEDVARGFQEVGTFLFAAEALSEAAMTFRSKGRMSSARSCAARAQALLTRCPGARTPALKPMDKFDELTPREREVATLAAGGLSNKAIATRLVISVRTVENQLQRTYRKLGITSRDELPWVLGL
jgi:tetratricopeptide (TPR) repeat protein